MDATETAELAALRDMFRAAPAELLEAHGIGLLELGEGLAVRVASLAGVRELNHALGVTGAAEIDDLRAFYEGGVHVVSPAPGCDLDEALAERGYEPGYAWMKFRREAAPPPPDLRPTDLRVVEAGPGAGADFGETTCAGYGLPSFLAGWLAQLPGRAGWHCFVAYDGAQPVATGALHVDGKTGWLGVAATLPSHRGRGAQTAILAARIRRGAERGCTLLVTETGERVEGRPSGSYRNILRSGFREAYLRPNYAPRAPFLNPTA